MEGPQKTWPKKQSLQSRRRVTGQTQGNCTTTRQSDRGFSDTKLFDFLEHELGFDYIIRTKSNIKVTDVEGNLFPIKEFLLPSGRSKTLKDVELTSKRHPVAKVIFTKKKGMKAAWFIVSS